MTDVDGVPLSDESIIAEIMGEYECLISVSDGVESLERSEGVVVDSQLSSMQFFRKWLCTKYRCIDTHRRLDHILLDIC